MNPHCGISSIANQSIRIAISQVGPYINSTFFGRSHLQPNSHVPTRADATPAAMKVDTTAARWETAPKP